MEYYVKSVVPIIESNYDNFTTVEKNIACGYRGEKSELSQKVADYIKR